jgi:hypothetical protein
LYNKSKKIRLVTTRNYEEKINDESVYTFLPKNFDPKWYDCSCITPKFKPSKCCGSHYINVTKNTYVHKDDIYINFKDGEFKHDQVIIDRTTGCGFYEGEDFDWEDYYTRDLNGRLGKWLIGNTYLVTIISPQYGQVDSHLSKFLISLL